ncbi:MAG: 50S ribosomal protein L21 [Polyangia bacterium]
MYAVITTGGKQYRVKAGDLLHVEKLDGAKGSVTFDQVLLVSDGGSVKVGAPTVVGAKVVADVITYTDKGAEAQGRPSTARSRGLGPKLIVYKYRRRKGYRRKNGHRQPFTAIKITSISA